MIQYVQNKSSNIVDWFSSLTGFEQIMLVLLALAVFRLGGIRRDLRSIYREIAQPSRLPHFVSRRMPFGSPSPKWRAPLGSTGFGFQSMTMGRATPAPRDAWEQPSLQAKSSLYQAARIGSARFLAKDSGRRDI